MLPALLASLPGIASAAGGVMGYVWPQKNPADAANKYLRTKYQALRDNITIPI